MVAVIPNVVRNLQTKKDFSFVFHRNRFTGNDNKYKRIIGLVFYNRQCFIKKKIASPLKDGLQ